MRTITNASTIILLILGCLTSCEEQTTSEFSNRAVVEGYLFEGQTIKNIQLTELMAFENLGEQQEHLISKAEIELLIDDVPYILSEDDQNPGSYMLQDQNVILETGQQLTFGFNYNGELVTAETRVPSKPLNVKISESVKTVEPITDFWDLTQLADISVEVSWSNPDNAYYYVTVKNLESNPETVDPNDYIPDISGFDFPPVITEFSQIRFNQLNYYGTHEIIVHKVNAEYVDLYNSQNQDSRTVSDPLTNIVNGYGIFTAFATDTVYLEIKKPGR